MSSRQHSDWSQSGSTGTVDQCPALRTATTVVGPTPSERESAFGRGLASSDRTPTCYSRSTTAFAGAKSGIFLPLVAVILGLVLAGCGGGQAFNTAAEATKQSEPAATATPPEGTAGTLAANGAPAPVNGGPAVAAGQPMAVGTRITTSDLTPKDFTKALGKKAMIVVLTQPRTQLDKLVLREVKAAVNAAKPRKQLVMFNFEAGDYKAYKDIPELVGLYTAPSIAIVNRTGKLQNFWFTYVDRGLLLRSLQLAMRAPKSDLSPSDLSGGAASAPAAAPVDPAAAAPADPAAAPPASAPAAAPAPADAAGAPPAATPPPAGV